METSADIEKKRLSADLRVCCLGCGKSTSEEFR